MWDHQEEIRLVVFVLQVPTICSVVQYEVILFNFQGTVSIETYSYYCTFDMNDITSKISFFFGFFWLCCVLVWSACLFASAQRIFPNCISNPFTEYFKNGYTLYLNSGLSSSRNHYGQRVITREADLVTAHEFGHNWGSEHDPDIPECSPSASQGGSYLMYTYSVSGYDVNNKVGC